MTPKEKAKELIYKVTNTGKVKYLLHDNEIKELALIAVDYVLKMPMNYGDYYKESQYPQYYYDFWIEVKQEIEKL